MRFSKYGNPNIKTAYQTHYLYPELTAKKKQKLQEKLAQEQKNLAENSDIDQHSESLQDGQEKNQNLLPF